MKNSIFKIAFIVVLILSSGGFLYAVDCGPDLSQCQTWSSANITKQIEIPGYPGCMVTVDFQRTVCDGVVIIEHLTYVPDWLDPDCANVLNDLLDIDAQGTVTIDWTQHEQNLDKLFDEMAIDEFELAEQSASYPCPNNYFIIEYRKPSCLSHCISLAYHNTLGYIVYATGFDDCYQTVCCKLEYKMCRDENDEISITPSSNQEEQCNSSTPAHSCNTTAPFPYTHFGVLVSGCIAQCDY